MKKRMIYLFTLVTTLILGITIVTGVFSIPRDGVVFTEEETHGAHGAKEGMKDTQDMKSLPEVPHSLPGLADATCHSSDLVLILTAAIQSLPEIPPELA